MLETKFVANPLRNEEGFSVVSAYPSSHAKTVEIVMKEGVRKDIDFLVAIAMQHLLPRDNVRDMKKTIVEFHQNRWKKNGWKIDLKNYRFYNTILKSGVGMFMLAMVPAMGIGYLKTTNSVISGWTMKP